MWVASKQVSGYEGLYRVTSDGRVWSERRCVGARSGSVRNIKGRWLKPSPHSVGYRQVTLCKDCVTATVYVHRLVAEAFVPKNGKPHVNHIDRVKTNNHFTNLEWVTPVENAHHYQSSLRG